jgi:predicted double-glycine peptidase
MSRFRRSLGWALGLTLLVVNVAPAAEPATEASRPGIGVRRHSLKELRDEYVVKQRLDYSCGAAALATLMRYYFNEPTSEHDVLRLLVARLDADERRVREMRGFTLLDLKYAAEALGYQAAGFKLTVADLVKLAAPVIVFIRPLGYAHFAVLRGIAGGRVFLADPARGNVRMSVGRFLGEWEGIVFVLGKPGEEGIGTHPLSVPRRDDIEPPLRSLNRLWESGAASIDLSRPARSR